MSNNPCNYITGVETIKTGRSELRMAVRLVAAGLAYRPIGCIRPQLQLPLVALYKCCAVTVLPLSTVINDIIML